MGGQLPMDALLQRCLRKPGQPLPAPSLVRFSPVMAAPAHVPNETATVASGARSALLTTPEVTADNADAAMLGGRTLDRLLAAPGVVQGIVEPAVVPNLGTEELSGAEALV